MEHGEKATTKRERLADSSSSCSPPAPLSAVHVNRPLVAANRAMAAVHAALVVTVIAQHALSVPVSGGGGAALLRQLLLAVADLTLLLLWALSQSGLWRPVTRSAFRDRLPKHLLPRLDVVVVTADPDKEPPLGVVNTVLSAMALHYPAAALTVYLSDDAGSPLTLLAARKAYHFAATAWVPFCRRHDVRCPWPDRYFQLPGDDGGDRRDDLAEERARVRKLYEKLKADIEAASKEESISGRWTKEKRQDHDAYVEIISSSSSSKEDGDGDEGDEEEEEVPALVYVAREKRRSCPHHFKAGALNALLRVSGVVSNAGYVLVLDCDMACNSRTSALDAMCFLLGDDDHDLGFVQFPQMFHNLSRNDMYTNELRYIFGTRWFGLDGVRGPILSGTGFFARRDALYGAAPGGAIFSTEDAKARFGDSDRLVASLRTIGGVAVAAEESAPTTLLAALASCAYEGGSEWGEGVGFMYQSVVEDYYTGYQRFFARGWTSAYCYPTEQALDVGDARRRRVPAPLAARLPPAAPPLPAHRALRRPRPLLRAPAAALPPPRRPALLSLGRVGVRVVAAAAPGGGVRGPAREAGPAHLVERAALLAPQRPHRPALRLRQRRPGPARRRQRFHQFQAAYYDLLLMCYGAALSYPLLEGMFLRRDPAKGSHALSVALAAVLLAVFSG